MADWWSDAPVISAAPAAAPKAEGGNWWSDHATIDAPSIPKPAPVAEPPKASSKPISERLQNMWDQATPGGPLWLAKQAVEGIKGSVENAQLAASTDPVLQNIGREGLPGSAMQAAQVLSPGVPRGTGGWGAAALNPIKSEAPIPSAAPVNDVVHAADNLGVKIPQYLATDNMAIQRMAATAKNAPIVGDQIIKSAQGVNEGLGNAAKTVQEGFGTGSVPVAGSAAKDALENWITEGSKAVPSRLYGNVDAMIDNSVRTPLESTRGVIADLAAKRQNAFITGRSKAIDQVLDAVQAPNGLNYNGIKDLRSHFGEMISDKLNTQGLSQKEAKALYSGLSRDLENSVEQSGGKEALQAWQAANNAHSVIQDQKAQLAKIVGAKGDAAPEAVFAKLVAMAGSKSNADLGKLLLARKKMGAGPWNEVASAAVSGLGRDAQGKFSPDRFLTAWGKFSDPGKKALFGSTGKSDIYRSLEDIATVSSHIKDKIGQFENHSRTAHGVIGAGMATALIHEPLTLISSIIGGAAVAEALSKPATAKAVADYSKAYVKTIDQPKARGFLVASARNLVNALGVKGINAQSLLNQLQGSVPAAANDQQQQ